MATDWKTSARDLGAAAETGRQARALLGEALNRLHDDGYLRLEQVSTLAGQRDEIAGDLDNQRMYAERVYGDVPLEDEAPLADQMRTRVGVALWSIARALEREQGYIDADIGYLSGFVEGLRRVFEAAGGLAPKLADAIPWWVWLLLVAAAAFYVRRILP
jgi:hypothetical protein